MEKRFEKEERLKHIENEEERKKEEERMKAAKEEHKKHEKLPEPGHKKQLEEVWEEVTLNSFRVKVSVLHFIQWREKI